MAEALYTPGLGYYSGGAHKFGPGGDFITAPELTPLFGQALASQVQQIMSLSAPHVIEAGAGTGLLAADLLLELELRGALPESYAILEVSGELRERQFDTLAAKVPHLASACMARRPARAFLRRAGGQRGARRDAGAPDRLAARRHLRARRRPRRRGPVRVGRPAGHRQGGRGRQALDLPLPEEGEYVSELNLAGRAWVAEWAARLDQGAMLLVDYGYPRAEYYLPSRSTGTLLCYFRHHAHGDPFVWPGLNDITAFVDFTAIAEAGFEAGSMCSATPTRPTCCSTAACSTAWRAGRPRRAPTTSAPPRPCSASPAPTRWANCSR
jgi:hypothetical protein